MALPRARHEQTLQRWKCRNGLIQSLDRLKSMRPTGFPKDLTHWGGTFSIIHAMVAANSRLIKAHIVPKDCIVAGEASLRACSIMRRFLVFFETCPLIDHPPSERERDDDDANPCPRDGLTC
jgi:hypothetical protein